MFDLVLLFVLLLTVLVGVLRGAIKEVFGAAVVVISVITTYHQGGVFLELFDVDPGPIVTPLSGISVFITSFVVLSLVSSWIIYLLSPVRLGPVDRMLGALLGALRGIVYCYFLFAFLNIFYYGLNGNDIKDDTEESRYYLPEWLKVARSYNVLNYFDSAFNSVVPEEVFVSLRGYSATLRDDVGEVQESDDRMFVEGMLNSLLDEKEEVKSPKKSRRTTTK